MTGHIHNPDLPPIRQSGWLQLELREPTIAVRGDRYILRRPSPGETIGGGVVMDPQPKRRHKRFDETVLSQLEALRQGSPADVLQQAFQMLGAAPIRDAVTRARLPGEQAQAALSELLENGQLVLLETGETRPESDLLACGQAYWMAESERARHEVETYHHTYPLRRGMPREALKSRLKVAAPRLFNAMLRRWVADGLLEEGGSLVWRPGHAIRFTPQQQAQIDRLLAKFAQSPYAPPTVKEVQAEVGEDVYLALVDLGQLVAVSPEVAFRKMDYDQMVALVYSHFEKESTLSAAQFRDLLNTSRRYVLAFLEHLDATGVTLREGDVRRLRRMQRA
ncbi:MAG TPA: SelB C-terminal domain-containing protein [Aggregatilineaceae bacterium]|nr:SelB C-terminal domain-containing protein [Aggregatilineaceae bacterium]